VRRVSLSAACRLLAGCTICRSLPRAEADIRLFRVFRPARVSLQSR
jgi:hypothetical protein